MINDCGIVMLNWLKKAKDKIKRALEYSGDHLYQFIIRTTYDRRLRDAAPFACYAIGIATVALLSTFMGLASQLYIGLDDTLIVFNDIKVRNIHIIYFGGINLLILLIGSSIKIFLCCKKVHPNYTPTSSSNDKLTISMLIAFTVKCSLVFNCLPLWFVFWRIISYIETKKYLFTLLESY